MFSFLHFIEGCGGVRDYGSEVGAFERKLTRIGHLDHRSGVFDRGNHERQVVTTVRPQFRGGRSGAGFELGGARVQTSRDEYWRGFDDRFAMLRPERQCELITAV